MIMLRTLGAELLARLMDADGEQRPDLSWLMFGPTDASFVLAAEEPDVPPRLLAAE